MIRLEEQEFEELEKKKEIVENIEVKASRREALNFITAHIMVFIGLVITLMSSL